MPRIPTDRLLHSSIAQMAIDTTDRFTSKGGPHLAAALTFFTLFSLAPLLIFVVAFAGLILGQETARAELVGQVSEVMGPEIAAQVDAIVVSTQQTASGTIAVLFGLASVAYGASRVFRGLQGGLNFMWDARPRKRNLVVGYLIDRVVSWGAAFLAGISLAATLSLFVALTASGATHLGRLINVTWLNDALGAVISLCVISVMFAAIYRFVPAVDIGWRDVLPAAGLVSAALFIGARLVGMVLGYAGPGASYLVASVPTIILIWINISAQIVYFGAAFTVIYAHRYGSLRQDDDAPEQEASRAP